MADYGALLKEIEEPGIDRNLDQLQHQLRVAEASASINRSPDYKELVEAWKSQLHSETEALFEATRSGHSVLASYLTGKIDLLRVMIAGPEQTQRLYDDALANINDVETEARP